MGRAPRADEAGGIYHALNRGNARHDIFFKDADFEAFERIVAEALERCQVDLICYQWMKNHWHMVLSPRVDGGMSEFVGWLTLTHTQRYHAHHGTLVMGTSIKAGTEASPSRTTRIFIPFAATSSVTR